MHKYTPDYTKCHCDASNFENLLSPFMTIAFLHLFQLLPKLNLTFRFSIFTLKLL